MYVCNCHGLTEKDINILVDYGYTYESYAPVIKSSGACCKCLPQVKEIFNEIEASYDKNYKCNNR